MIRRHKYGAKKVKLDGYTFDSKAEAKRYGELKLLEKNGEIDALIVHPRYIIEINGDKICTVVLDFSYLRIGRGGWTREDVKGMDNPLSRLKRKLVEAQYGIKVEVIKGR